jgi:hypothetical protein
MRRIMGISVLILFCCLWVHTGLAQTFIPRNYYGARLEPVNKVFSGAGQGNWSTAISDYRQALKGKYDPAVINDYFGFENSTAATDTFVSKMKTWLAQCPNYTVLQIGVPFGSNAYEGGPFVDKSQDIADGKYDTQIKYLYSKLNDLNVPIYFRFGFEANGAWNGYPVASYKPAFIRAVNFLRSSVLANNSAAVWNIAAAGSSSYASWYPGDQYVDWWSIDLFNPAEITSSLTSNYFRDADIHGKPVMIGESTAAPGVNKGWDTWFKPYFELIHNNPGIKSFNYINWDWRSMKNSQWGDCRIQQSASVTASYAQEMASPLYAHASTIKAFGDNLKPPAPKSLTLK